MQEADTRPVAIQGEFVELRKIDYRKVYRIYIEVPMEQGDAVIACFGGLPKGQWIGMAPLDSARVAAKPAVMAGPPAERAVHKAEPRKWREVPPSAQAGMLASDPEFQAWVGAATEQEAAAYIRNRCGITSRSELNTNPLALQVWQAMSRAFFGRYETASQEQAMQEGP